MSEILTPEQVADHFKLPVSYVKKMVREGLWPHWKPSANSRHIRFTEANLQEIESAIQLSTASSSTGRKSK